MTSSLLRIVTRESPLAMWQANFVKNALARLYPGTEIKILGITTEADQRLETSLEKLGGKGAFVKELEQALLNDKADIAVHSMKDVTINMPEGLIVPVIMEREDPRDVMISTNYAGLEAMPAGSRIGTSSLRRRCQLMAIRPDLEILDIRGNVGTRLRKLDEGEYDALLLASAGVIRLGLLDRITQYFDTQQLLPAVAQAALGIEIRDDRPDLLEMIEPLRDEATQRCVSAERALNRVLGGDCHVPIAAYAHLAGANMEMQALVGSLDGSHIIRVKGSSTATEGESLGARLGYELLEKGAGEILAKISSS